MVKSFEALAFATTITLSLRFAVGIHVKHVERISPSTNEVNVASAVKDVDEVQAASFDSNGPAANAFVFLLYGDSVDSLVSARALYQGLRRQGAQSDVVAMVPKTRSPPERYLNILRKDGIHINLVESMPEPTNVLSRWNAVMDKMCAFSLTDYFRVALLDLDIVVDEDAHPESIFDECPGQEFCAIQDVLFAMPNAGVMLFQTSKARYLALRQAIAADTKIDHNDTYPEQQFLQRYDADASNDFSMSFKMATRFNSCPAGAWLLNTGETKTGFVFIHSCAWGAKFFNIQACKSPSSCRRSVLLFQKYHQQADPCFSRSLAGKCKLVPGCAWCGHYCSSSSISCSSTLFAVEDNPDSYVVDLELPENQVVANLAHRPDKVARHARKMIARFLLPSALEPIAGAQELSRHSDPKIQRFLNSTGMYYAMVDRTAHPMGSRAPRCTALDDYCGGTLPALEKMTPYFRDLGVDGLVLSPLTETFPKGYHGYWTKSFEVNPHFGALEQARKFTKSLRNLGMYAVGDINLNSAGRGIEDLGSLGVFNKSEYFHGCDGCNSVCSIDDYDNLRQIQNCRLFGMPDLNHEHPWVREVLKDFAVRYVDTYGFSGLRLDAARHVPAQFISELQNAAVFGGQEIPIMPEFYTDDVEKVTKLTFDKPAIVMNFPSFLGLRSAFVNGTSMEALQAVQINMVKSVIEPWLLVNFVNTHDAPRFLAVQPDIALYSNALTYAFCLEGIPMLLYGDEQDLTGHADPDDANGFRVPLWHAGFNRQSSRFKLIQETLKLRKTFKDQQYLPLHADDNVLVYSRGLHIVVVNNFGTGNKRLPAQRVVHLSNNTGLCAVEKWCDVFATQEGSCIRPNPLPIDSSDADDSYVYGSYGPGAQEGLAACFIRVEIGRAAMPAIYKPEPADFHRRH